MARKVDLQEATEVIQEAGFDDPNLSSQEVWQIYSAIKESETIATLGNVEKILSQEEVVEEFTPNVSTHKMNEFRIPCSKQIKRSHHNPEKHVVGPNYVPLRCSSKYVKGSREDRVKILLEDFDVQRKVRNKLASKSLIRAPLPPPILLPILKRRKSIEDVVDGCRNVENRSPSNEMVNPENYPWSSIKIEDHTIEKGVIDEIKLEEPDVSLFKFSPKKRKQNGSDDDFQWENDFLEDDPIFSTEFHKRLKKNKSKPVDDIENQNLPKINILSDVQVHAAKKQSSSTVTSKNLTKTNSSPSLSKQLNTSTNEARERRKRRFQESLNAITIDGQDEPENSSPNSPEVPKTRTGVKKQPSSTITSKKLTKTNASPSLSKQLNTSTNEAREHRKRRFNESLNAITIDGHDERENSSPNSPEVHKTVMTRTEVKKQPSSTITSKKLTKTNASPSLSKQLNTSTNEAREHRKRRFNESLNAITIDGHDERENSSPNSPEVHKTVMTRTEVDVTFGLSKFSRFHPENTPKPFKSRADRLFDNLIKEDAIKERQQAVLDKFTESLDTDNVTIDDHSDGEEDNSSNWLSSARTGLNRSGVSSAVTNKMRKAPLEIYKSEFSASINDQKSATSIVQQTDCPFCGKLFSILVIENHCILCEKSRVLD